MANLNIRRLDESTHAKLRLRAAGNRRSMEEEARQILRAALDEPPKDERIWEWLRRRAIERQGGVPLEGDSTDLIREDRDA
jgi:plasmid stability protein